MTGPDALIATAVADCCCWYDKQDWPYSGNVGDGLHALVCVAVWAPESRPGRARTGPRAAASWVSQRIARD